MDAALFSVLGLMVAIMSFHLTTSLRSYSRLERRMERFDEHLQRVDERYVDLAKEVGEL